MPLVAIKSAWVTQWRWLLMRRHWLATCGRLAVFSTVLFCHLCKWVGTLCKCDKFLMILWSRCWNLYWFYQWPDKRRLLPINHVPTGAALTLKRAPVSESINHQQLTWTRYVTIWFMPPWLCSRSTVQHTCSYVLHPMINQHTLSVSCSLNTGCPRRCSDCYLCGDGDGDVTVQLRSGWCRVKAFTSLSPALSLSHIHTFTRSRTQTHKHLFQLRDPLPPILPPLSSPRPTVASHAIYSPRWFTLACSFQPLCNLSLTYLRETEWSVCVWPLCHHMNHLHKNLINTCEETLKAASASRGRCNRLYETQFYCFIHCSHSHCFSKAEERYIIGLLQFSPYNPSSVVLSVWIPFYLTFNKNISMTVTHTSYKFYITFYSCMQFYLLSAHCLVHDSAVYVVKTCLFDSCQAAVTNLSKSYLLEKEFTSMLAALWGCIEVQQCFGWNTHVSMLTCP